MAEAARPGRTTTRCPPAPPRRQRTTTHRPTTDAGHPQTTEQPLASQPRRRTHCRRTTTHRPTSDAGRPPQATEQPLTGQPPMPVGTPRRPNNHSPANHRCRPAPLTPNNHSPANHRCRAAPPIDRTTTHDANDHSHLHPPPPTNHSPANRRCPSAQQPPTCGQVRTAPARIADGGDAADADDGAAGGWPAGEPRRRGRTPGRIISRGCERQPVWPIRSPVHHRFPASRRPSMPDDLGQWRHIRRLGDRRPDRRLVWRHRPLTGTPTDRSRPDPAPSSRIPPDQTIRPRTADGGSAPPGHYDLDPRLDHRDIETALSRRRTIDRGVIMRVPDPVPRPAT